MSQEQFEEIRNLLLDIQARVANLESRMENVEQNVLSLMGRGNGDMKE